MNMKSADLFEIDFYISYFLNCIYIWMIIIDLFDIDFHIFTVIKFLFNLGVRFNYIYDMKINHGIKFYLTYE